MLPITPENLPGVLTGVGAIFSAIAGWTLWKVRKETPEDGSAEAMRVAMAQNTAALQSMNGQFGENIRLFREVVKSAEALHEEARETRRATETCRDHLGAIRDSLNRRSM